MKSNPVYNQLIANSAHHSWKPKRKQNSTRVAAQLQRHCHCTAVTRALKEGFLAA